MRINDQQFTNIWNTSETVEDVVKKTGYKYNTVRSKKRELALKGYEFKNMKLTKTNRTKTSLVGKANKKDEK